MGLAKSIYYSFSSSQSLSQFYFIHVPFINLKLLSRCIMRMEYTQYTIGPLGSGLVDSVVWQNVMDRLGVDCWKSVFLSKETRHYEARQE